MSQHYKPLSVAGSSFLLAFAFTAGNQALAQVCVQPPSGIIGWWDGDSVNGNIAEDIIGTNDGTLLDNSSTVPGKVGDAFSFDGVDDGITITKNGDLHFGASDFTIEAWVKSDTPGSAKGFVFSNYAGVPFYGLSFHPNGFARLSFRDAAANYVQAISTTNVNDGQWHHIAGVRQGATGYIYVDGILDGSATVPGVGSVDATACLYARIGSTHTGPDNCTTFTPGPTDVQYEGLIDEVSVFDSALSPGDIQDIYDADSAGKCNPNADQNPVADAGSDQAIRTLPESIMLDGSASFDDNTTSSNLLYSWQFVSVPVGSSAVLSGSNTALPSFAADVLGTFQVELIVTDEAGLVSAPDTVDVSSGNLAPTADAGLRQVVPDGDVVSLDGSGSSDPENDPLDFFWSFDAIPAGSGTILFGANTQNPFFTPDIVGNYIVSLTVADAIGPGTPDSTDISAIDTTVFVNLQLQRAVRYTNFSSHFDFTSRGNKQALNKLVLNALKFHLRGLDPSRVIRNIQRALERTDGCALRGAPDGNGPGRDWVNNCTAQAQLYPLLTSALAALD